VISVPLGKYSRSSPLVFSLVPRSHGEWGVGEEHVHGGREGEPGVGGHLAALVPGQRLDQLRGHVGHGGDERVAGGHRVASTGGQGDRDDVAGGALDQRGHRAASGLPDHVGSDRGAVPGSLPARFPLRTVRAPRRCTRLKQAARALRVLASCVCGLEARGGRRCVSSGFGSYPARRARPGGRGSRRRSPAGPR